MHLAPRRNSTWGDLLRLLAVWLAALLVLQGQAAAQARASGPLHRHQAVEHAAGSVHRHQHGLSERHLHAAATPGVLMQASAEDGLDAAASALAAAFSLLASAGLPRVGAAAGGVWHAAPGWPSLTAPLIPLRKPPRHG